MNWLKKLLCKWFHIGCTPPVPPGPLPPCRPGLLFCYYGTQAGEAAETGDHVNMVHVGAWGDWTTGQGRLDMTNEIITFAHAAVAAGVHRIMFTLDWCLLAQTNPRQLLPESTAVVYLQAFYQRIIDEGLAPYVYAWYIVDEPNIPEINLSGAQLETINALVRASTNGTVFANLPLAAIYGPATTYQGVQSFDWVGIDNYDEYPFDNGQYQHLVSQLKPTQKTFLVPGGGSPWKQDPRPYYYYAQGDQRVIMLMPFKWFDPDGIVNNGMAPAYREVGRAIKTATP